MTSSEASIERQTRITALKEELYQAKLEVQSAEANGDTITHAKASIHYATVANRLKTQQERAEKA